MPTPIKKLPMMGVREFRDRFPTLDEPVRVIRATRGIEILGVWAPDVDAVKKRAAAPKGKTDG